MPTDALPRLDPAFIAAVNARLAGEAALIAQVDAPPVPRGQGEWPLDPALADARAAWVERLAGEGRPNEPHALLADGDSIAARADYAVVDFATVCAMRERGRRPRLLSAGGLAVCAERGCVLLQRRSRWVSTYPGCLDIVGGAFQPPAPGFTGDSGLADTVAREFQEETGIALAPSRHPPAVIAGQLRAGFSGYIELGLAVDAAALDAAVPSREGELVPMNAGALAAAFADPKERWVPTARMHVLAWLALGARAWDGDGDAGPVFDRQQATRLLAGFDAGNQRLAPWS